MTGGQPPGHGCPGPATVRNRRSGVRFDPDDERLVRAVWSRISEPGDPGALRLVAEEGPVGALRAVLSGTPETARWRVRLAAADPNRDLAAVHALGGRLVVPGDQEWPDRLEDLGPATPHCLWVRGPHRLDSYLSRSVSVVGARAATAYGEYVSAGIAAGLTDRGVTVVSGAAYGIDGAAHRGALAEGGPTAAVLACGLDRAYPQGHRQLIERIAVGGVVLTELPPGSAPTRWRFLERNRLIAALSEVTVVVEAAHRSGALGTAGRAGRLSRVVAAVPGPVTSLASAGCHDLLRDGAVCVTDAAEVLELLSAVGEQLPLPVEVPASDHDGLVPADIRLLDALPMGRGVEIASLARTACLTEAEVWAGLGRLEVRGVAQRAGLRWRRRVPAAGPTGGPR